MIVYSTTGTAPIEITGRHDGLITITLEDGSSQVYNPGHLLEALDQT